MRAMLSACVQHARAMMRDGGTGERRCVVAETAATANDWPPCVALTIF